MDRGRVFELDVLRGFAIILVMGVHVPAYPIWSTFGGFGVDLFFVLSGFLISGLLFVEYQRTGDIRLARFFSRRALKLYPSFYLLLLVTLLYGYFWRVPFSAQALLGEAVLTQNYIGAIWGHTWSLAVEEHFYLLLPLLLAFLVRRGRGSADPFRPLPYIFLGVAAVCLALRSWNTASLAGFDHKTTYQPSHLRFDSLLYGVFLSYFHHFRPDALNRIMSDPWRSPVSLLSVICLAPALFLPWDDPVVYTLGFTLLYIGFGTMIPLALYKPTNQKVSPPGRGLRGVAYMGVYSYTLYLWHVPLAQVFAWLSSRWGGVNQYLLHAIYFATCIAVGVLTSKLLERPVLRIRERLFPPATAIPSPHVPDVERALA